MKILEQKIEIMGIPTSVKQRHGRGTPVICIHGNSLSQRLFSPLMEAQNLIENPIITYDLPGHGNSGTPENPETDYSLPGYGAHLKNLVSTLGLENVILFGFSLGGHIALEAAGHHLGRKVKGVFSIGAPPIDTVQDIPEAFQTFPGGISLFTEDLTEQQILLIVENIVENKTLQKILFEDIRKTDRRARKYLVETMMVQGKCHSEHEYLKVSKIPVNLVFGDNDALIKRDYIQKENIRRLLGPRMKIIDNCSHLPDWIGNSDFLRIFISLLRQIIADSP